MHSDRNEDEMRMKVREMISGIGTAIMTTIDEQGRLRGRPMRGIGPDQDGRTLWFFTRMDSPKVAELKADSRVLLGYADVKSQDYVALSGRARIVTDAAKKKELWAEPMRTWLPEGPEGADVGLIAVEIEGAEYWDGVSSTLRFAFGYAKALATGEPAHTGENAKVAFR